MVKEGTGMGVEYCEHLASSPSFLTQMRFSVFAVVSSITVAFLLRSHPGAASSGDRYIVCNFFRPIHQWTRKLTPSRNEHRICGGPQDLLPVGCETTSVSPAGTCFDVGQRVYPHHSSVGRA